jgi:hypothetical protein
MSRHRWLTATWGIGSGALLSLLACSSASQSGSPANETSPAAVDASCSQASQCGGSGDKANVDGGEASAPKGRDGEKCASGAECASQVCTGGVCQAPSTSDQVQNGDETDVDCGGASPQAVKCAAGKKCVAGTDCASNACPAGRCSEAPSCAQPNGGATCGPGEVGDPAAKHEDCCASAVVPRPAASGGPFRLDKYLITAGRMRVFLESVNYDVKGYIETHRPAWWTGSGTSGWDAMLPSNEDEFISMTATGGSGCFIGSSKGQSGAPAFWSSAADLARVVGGAARKYTQAELDTKVMNCFRAPLFHALCAFDGGRLPSRDEWIAARTENGVVRPYPWGSNGSDADRRANASYDFDYAWPNEPSAADSDLGGYLPAPGRFPLGNGPYGHADLLGGVENMGSKPAAGGGVTGDGWFQFSFQEAAVTAYGQQSVGFGSGSYRNHWAVGARCLKLP